MVLPSEELATLQHCVENINMVYWKEWLIHYRVPIVKNHIISKEVLQQAILDLHGVIERWV